MSSTWRDGETEGNDDDDDGEGCHDAREQRDLATTTTLAYLETTRMLQRAASVFHRGPKKEKKKNRQRRSLLQQQGVLVDDGDDALSSSSSSSASSSSISTTEDEQQGDDDNGVKKPKSSYHPSPTKQQSSAVSFLRQQDSVSAYDDDAMERTREQEETGQGALWGSEERRRAVPSKSTSSVVLSSRQNAASPSGGSSSIAMNEETTVEAFGASDPQIATPTSSSSHPHYAALRMLKVSAHIKCRHGADDDLLAAARRVCVTYSPQARMMAVPKRVQQHQPHPPPSANSSREEGRTSSTNPSNNNNVQGKLDAGLLPPDERLEHKNHLHKHEEASSASTTPYWYIVPYSVFISVSDGTLVDNALLRRVTRFWLWPVVSYTVTIVALLLTDVVGRFTVSWYVPEEVKLTMLSLAFVLMAIQGSQYSPTYMTVLIKMFDFWLLLGSVTTLLMCDLYVALPFIKEAELALFTAVSLLFLMTTLCIDTWFLKHRAKGLVMLVTALYYGATAVFWAARSQDHPRDAKKDAYMDERSGVIKFGTFARVHVEAVAQAAAFTATVYQLKLSMRCLLKGYDAAMVRFWAYLFPMDYTDEDEVASAAASRTTRFDVAGRSSRSTTRSTANGNSSGNNNKDSPTSFFSTSAKSGRISTGVSSPTKKRAPQKKIKKAQGEENDTACENESESSPAERDGLMKSGRKQESSLGVSFFSQGSSFVSGNASSAIAAMPIPELSRRWHIIDEEDDTEEQHHTHNDDDDEAEDRNSSSNTRDAGDARSKRQYAAPEEEDVVAFRNNSSSPSQQQQPRHTIAAAARERVLKGLFGTEVRRQEEGSPRTTDRPIALTSFANNSKRDGRDSPTQGSPKTKRSFGDDGSSIGKSFFFGNNKNTSLNLHKGSGDGSGKGFVHLYLAGTLIVRDTTVSRQDIFNALKEALSVAARVRLKVRERALVESSSFGADDALPLSFAAAQNPSIASALTMGNSSSKKRSSRRVFAPVSLLKTFPSTVLISQRHIAFLASFRLSTVLLCTAMLIYISTLDWLSVFEPGLAIPPRLVICAVAALQLTQLCRASALHMLLTVDTWFTLTQVLVAGASGCFMYYSIAVVHHPPVASSSPSSPLQSTNNNNRDDDDVMHVGTLCLMIAHGLMFLLLGFWIVLADGIHPRRWRVLKGCFCLALVVFALVHVVVWQLRINDRSVGDENVVLWEGYWTVNLSTLGQSAAFTFALMLTKLAYLHLVARLDLASFTFGAMEERSVAKQARRQLLKDEGGVYSSKAPLLRPLPLPKKGGNSNQNEQVVAAQQGGQHTVSTSHSGETGNHLRPKSPSRSALTDPNATPDDVALIDHHQHSRLHGHSDAAREGKRRRRNSSSPSPSPLVSNSNDWSLSVGVPSIVVEAADA